MLDIYSASTCYFHIVKLGQAAGRSYKYIIHNSIYLSIFLLWPFRPSLKNLHFDQTMMTTSTY